MSSTAVATQRRALGTFTAGPSSASPKRTPSTPQTKAVSAARFETPSPGRWRHPKMQELASRRQRNTFDNSNVRMILANLAALALTWSWRSLLFSIPFLCPGASPSTPMAQSTVAACTEIFLSIVFATNIFRALRPLFKLPDNAADIDLNAEQRALLGLDPNATPPETTSTKYLTPPKYARSTSASPASFGSGASIPSRASSLSASFGSSVRSSPASTSLGNLSTLRNASDSPNYVNLWQRKVAASRRSSLGTSPLAAKNGSPGASTSAVPAYGDRDAWLLTPGASPPKRDEWRFVPGRAWRRSSGGPNAAGGGVGGVGGTGGSSNPLAQAGAAQAGSKPSPLSMSLEGTGLWGAGLGASGFGASVFRPDTPSPVGRGASGVPLKNKWLYERGRDDRRYS